MCEIELVQVERLRLKVHTFVLFLENDQSFHKIKPLFLCWDRVEPFEASLFLQHNVNITP